MLLSQSRIQPERWELDPSALERYIPTKMLECNTLVIPDIHNRVQQAEGWFRTLKSRDRLVFVGDYFDDFDDTLEDARRTALWIKRWVHDPRVVMLMGNHDVQYFWPEDDRLFCSGYTCAKAEVIRSVLQPADWNRMRLAYHIEGWLISHAGFHPAWMKDPSVEKILDRCALAEKRAAHGELDPILEWGETPGGVQRFGGPLWMDWANFYPLPGINQLVGHTSGATVRFCSIPGSLNACIDVGRGSIAAMISHGNLSFCASPLVGREHKRSTGDGIA